MGAAAIGPRQVRVVRERWAALVARSTADALARELEVNVRTLRRWRRGERIPHATVQRLVNGVCARERLLPVYPSGTVQLTEKSGCRCLEKRDALMPEGVRVARARLNDEGPLRALLLLDRGVTDTRALVVYARFCPFCGEAYDSRRR